MFKKNTAVTGFTFGLVSATDGSAITTGTVTGYYTLDGGTQATVAGTPVHEGNGQWSVNLTAAEMNGDIVGLIFTHASAIPVQFTIKTDTKIVSELNDLTTAQVNAECDTAISDAALATAANLATVDTVVDGIQADLSNGTDGLGALKTAIDAKASQTSVNTIDTNVDAILVDTGTTIPATLATLATAADLTTVDTVVDGIQTDLSNATDGLGALKALLDTLTTNLATVDTNVDAVLVDTGTSLPATLSTISGYLDTEIATIISNLATVDTIVDAIKAKTDSLTFTVANQVDANIQSINDTTITGDGGTTPFDVP